MAVLADDAGMPDQMSKCPFVQHNMNTKSGREEAMDLAFTAQAVLQGIVLTLRPRGKVTKHHNQPVYISFVHVSQRSRVHISRFFVYMLGLSVAVSKGV